MVFREEEPRPALHLAGFLCQKEGGDLHIFSADGRVLATRRYEPVIPISHAAADCADQKACTEATVWLWPDENHSLRKRSIVRRSCRHSRQWRRVLSGKQPPFTRFNNGGPPGMRLRPVTRRKPMARADCWK